MTSTYRIQWRNSRGELHHGPELRTHPDWDAYELPLTPEAFLKLDDPRPKTIEEAHELANRMNDAPWTGSNSHKVVDSDTTAELNFDDNERFV